LTEVSDDMARFFVCNCDRCDKNIPEKEIAEVRVLDFEDRVIDQFDLCKSCLNDLDGFKNEIKEIV
jgi:hypothetical protein